MSRDRGREGSPERRLAERRAIIDAHIAIGVRELKSRVESGWIHEGESPLGRADHIEATSRRMARQASGLWPIDAMIDAEGRHLLTIDAVADEWFRGPLSARSRRFAACVLGTRAANDNARAGGGR